MKEEKAERHLALLVNSPNTWPKNWPLHPGKQGPDQKQQSTEEGC